MHEVAVNELIQQLTKAKKMELQLKYLVSWAEMITNKLIIIQIFFYLIKSYVHKLVSIKIWRISEASR